MRAVTVRELRNRGGHVLDRVEAGETLLVTRGGRPVAELSPVAKRLISTDVILERFRKVPAVDIATLHRDLDAVVDPSL